MTSAFYVVMPDVVILAAAVLLADEAVSEIVGTRIASMSPQDVSTPWIRLHRVGGPRSATAPMRLVTATLQVDAFAPASTPANTDLISGDPGAMHLALLAEAALFAAQGFSNNAGVICHVSETQGPQSLPDTSRTPPTPRALFVLALTLRPN